MTSKDNVDPVEGYNQHCAILGVKPGTVYNSINDNNLPPLDQALNLLDRAIKAQSPNPDVIRDYYAYCFTALSLFPGISQYRDPSGSQSLTEKFDGCRNNMSKLSEEVGRAIPEGTAYVYDEKELQYVKRKFTLEDRLIYWNAVFRTSKLSFDGDNPEASVSGTSPKPTCRVAELAAIEWYKINFKGLRS